MPNLIYSIFIVESVCCSIILHFFYFDIGSFVVKNTEHDLIM